MWSFEIVKRGTEERYIVFGYDWKDAFRRAHIDPAEWDLWDVVFSEYED